MTISRSGIAALVLITAAGVGYFGIWPQWVRASSLRAEVRELQALRDELRELIRLRERLAADYGTISSPDIAKVLALAPSGPQPARLVVDLEAIAQRSGAGLTQVNVAADQPQAVLAPSASGLAPVSVSFGITATYEALQAFLSNLELNGRIVDVTAFSFAPAAAAGVPVSLQARAYYRP